MPRVEDTGKLRAMLTLIAQPHDSFRLGDFLKSEFDEIKWTEFRAAVAFAKRSGTQHIESGLAQFSKKASVRISVGIDHGGTSEEALRDLMGATLPNGQLWVYKNIANTFHPKIYLFSNKDEAVVLIGSGNLTKGGLYENAELGVRILLDLNKSDDKEFFISLNKVLEIWSTPTPNLCYLVDEKLIKLLCESGDLPTESEAHHAVGQSEKTLSLGKEPKKSPFKFAKVQTAPTMAKSSAPTKMGAKQNSDAHIEAKSDDTVSAMVHAYATMPVFAMTLQNTDVGVGQTTSGTQPRSPEVFIPLVALDENPAFWGWETQYDPDPKKYQVDLKWKSDPKNIEWMKEQAARLDRKPRPLEKLDWPHVRIQLAGHAEDVLATLWFNPKKKDIRIRESSIRAAGNIGDIFLMKSAPAGSQHVYEVEIVKKGTSDYDEILPKLITKVRGSKKHIGYI